MMGRQKPDYYDAVHTEAKEDWDSFEKHPKRAGPHRQLFQQMKASPRLVISELLQNADDARAKSVSIQVTDELLCLCHNGDDFTESQFRALCSFGCSDKTSLQTIGYRGIGFKSVFSLGHRVEVLTPTLAVAFEDRNNFRFYEPVWLYDAPESSCTQVAIPFDNAGAKDLIIEEIKRWQTSPIPLLFFINIESLQLQDIHVTKTKLGEHPSGLGQSISLNAVKNEVAVFWSDEEQFPEDCIEEIRNQRNASAEFDLPPCKVSIVLNAESSTRLYSVLPTEVFIHLPFSCHAPFLLEPDRKRIFDPMTKKTNRWLLERIGKLAADALQKWLGNPGLTHLERVKAYDLLPKIPQPDGTIDLRCAEIITKSMAQELAGAPILLTSEGELASKDDCLNLPGSLLDVWNVDTLILLFGEDRKYVLASEVKQKIRDLLCEWGLSDSFNPESLLDRFKKSPYPQKPDSDGKVIKIWSLLRRCISEHELYYGHSAKKLAILPVKSSNDLYPADKVAVLKKDALKPISNEDAIFLTSKIAVADLDGITELLDTQIASGDGCDAYELMLKLELNEPIGLQKLFERVSELIFKFSGNDNDRIYAAYIAARYDLKIPECFKFLTEDGEWHDVSFGIIHDLDSELIEMFPESWIRCHTLSDYYYNNLDDNDKNKWDVWVRSNKVNISTFPVLHSTKENIHSLEKANSLCTQRGHELPCYGISSWRKEEYYQFIDHDFPVEFWDHWQKLAADSMRFWTKLLKTITSVYSKEARFFCTSSLQRRQYNLEYRNISCEDMVSVWVLKFRDLPCLPDQHGNPHRPIELYRRTKDTEDLIEIKAGTFLHPEWDKPEYNEFLNALGVNTTLKDPGVLIARLIDLSQTKIGMRPEVSGIYTALDKIVKNIYGSDHEVIAANLRKEFTNHRIILCNDESWETLPNVFIRQAKDVQLDIPVIHGYIADLELWRAIGVREEPTPNMRLEWLRALPRDQELEPDILRGVKSILKATAHVAYDNLDFWLNLDDCLVNKATLKWQTQDKTHLPSIFPWVNEQTADMTMVKSDVGDLPLLESTILLQVEAENGRGSKAPIPQWLNQVVRYMMRVKDLHVLVDGRLDTSDNHDLLAAHRLADSSWVRTDSIYIVPYLNNLPAGPESPMLVAWEGNTIYVNESMSMAEICDKLGVGLANKFEDQNIKRALVHCIDRNDDWIRMYFESEFDLLPEELAETPTSDPDESIPGKPGDPGTTTSDIGYESRLNEGVEVPIPPINGLSKEEEDVDDTPGGKERNPRPPRESSYDKQIDLLSAALVARGYASDNSTGNLRGPNGETIRRMDGPFPWRETGINGEEIARYWIGRQTFQDGVEIPSEIWDLIFRKPEFYWIILPHPVQRAVAYQGTQLKELSESGELRVYNAVYRIRQTETSV